MPSVAAPGLLPDGVIRGLDEKITIGRRCSPSLTLITSPMVGSVQALSGCLCLSSHSPPATRIALLRLCLHFCLPHFVTSLPSMDNFINLISSVAGFSLPFLPPSLRKNKVPRNCNESVMGQGRDEEIERRPLGGHTDGGKLRDSSA